MAASDNPEKNSLALLKQKCPRCHTGNVFPHPTYSAKFMDMHPLCLHCGQDFEIEPGFYYGAMYISYGITIIIGIVLMILAHLILGEIETWIYLILLLIVLLALSPVSFRYSRLCMLYWFGSVDYDPTLRGK